LAKWPAHENGFLTQNALSKGSEVIEVIEVIEVSTLDDYEWSTD